MPTVPFDHQRRLIRVPAAAIGLDGRQIDLTLILDTSAANIGLVQSVASDLGMDIQTAARFVRVSTPF